MSPPFIIGIAGGTASGKTTISRRYAEVVGATLVGHDRYYQDVTDRRTFNFDHPESLETALLVSHLEALRRGQAVELPVYDFASHRRLTTTERLQGGELIVVEGILVLENPALRACFDLTVYVDAPADVRLARRLRRDIVERGRSVESVLDQYLETVRPMHEEFVAPTRQFAEVVLDGEGSVEEAVETLRRAVSGAG